jgi:hypothetical protein
MTHVASAASAKQFNETLTWLSDQPVRLGTSTFSRGRQRLLLVVGGPIRGDAEANASDRFCVGARRSSELVRVLYSLAPPG